MASTLPVKLRDEKQYESEKESKPDMINSAPPSMECEVCHARLATTIVVEFIRACGLCAKTIEDLIERKIQLAAAK